MVYLVYITLYRCITWVCTLLQRMYEFMGQVDDDESAGFKVGVPHSFNPASFCWPRNSFLGKIFGSSKDALAIKKKGLGNFPQKIGLPSAQEKNDAKKKRQS